MLANFAAVQSYAQSDANAVITRNAGNTSTVQTVQVSALLQQGDFLFY